MLDLNNATFNDNKPVKTSKKKFLFLMYAFFIIAIFLVVATIMKNQSHAANDLPSSTQIPAGRYTYYLDVEYEGQSITGVTLDYTSGVIHVEDKLPYGVEFINLKSVTTTGQSCNPTFLDNDNFASSDALVSRDGIYYNKLTRKVFFDIDGLTEDCTVRVGINVNINDDTSAGINEFYNYASAREGNLTVNSNLKYNYIKPLGTNYDVEYEYSMFESDGVTPVDASAETAQVPPTMSYSAGNTVEVMPELEIPGYTFSGWTTTDATVTDNRFTMPDKDVTFSATYTKNTSHSVTYNVSGMPAGYAVPATESHATGEIIILDSIKENDIVDGLKFSGWTVKTTINNVETEIDIRGNEFVMPDGDVVVTGSFVKASFTVTYAFYNTVLPPNSDTLLPANETHTYGEVVTVAAAPTDPTGYKFLGWYSDDSFEMPNEDITIYGEWKRFNGTFDLTPTLIVNAVNGTPWVNVQNNSFQTGDVVEYTLTITNSNAYAVNNVYVKDYLKGAEVDSYASSFADNYAVISSIPANSSANVTIYYTITSSDAISLENKVEILSAETSNYYELGDNDYTATAPSVKISQSRLSLCQVIGQSDYDVPPVTFQYKIYSNNSFETWVSLKGDVCKNITLPNDEYSVKQVTPQEFDISTVTGAITVNGDSFIVGSNTEYTITFTNKYMKKSYMHSFGKIINLIVGGVS